MAVLDSSRSLKKELSLFNVYTIATGATLSSGFFLLPGLAALEAGPAVVICYLLAIFPLLPGILSKIELATAMPRAGGEYYFLDRSLGPLIGTISGSGTWIALVLKTAFALMGIGAYLRLFLPSVNMVPVAVFAALLFGVINFYGARRSSTIQSVLVLGLLGLLTWFISSGLTSIRGEHFEDFRDRDLMHILVAAGLVSISYMGITKVASVAEEVKNPERNLPLGILLALVTAVLVYGLGTLVMVGVLSPAQLAGNLTAVTDTARLIGGHSGAVLMTVAAMFAFMSVANAGILSGSRYPLAMSRDHLLPPLFGRLNRQQVPRNAVVMTVVLVLVCVTLLDPSKIAKLASAFLLMLFALNCVAVVVMRESRIESYDPGFRAPWYPWAQVVGILAPFALIIVMGWLPILFTFGLMGVGTLWYFYYARPRVQRGGAIFHLFARLGALRFEGLDRELRSILKEKGLRSDDPYDELVARAPVIDQGGQVTFEQVVRSASECLAIHLPISAKKLAKRFMEGPRVGATPVSKGVALPHLRLPDLDRPLIVLVRDQTGLHVNVDSDFLDHAYNQPIYALVFLISPETDPAQHLRILAQIAHRIDHGDFMREWLAADSPDRLKQILLREDRFLNLQLQVETTSEQLIGQKVCDLHLPKGSLIAMIHRDANMLVPSGDTILARDDRLPIVGMPETISQLRKVYGHDQDLD